MYIIKFLSVLVFLQVLMLPAEGAWFDRFYEIKQVSSINSCWTLVFVAKQQEVLDNILVRQSFTFH